MSVLINKETKVICQGFTGAQGPSTVNRRLSMAPRWWVVSARGKAVPSTLACLYSTRYARR